MTGSGPVAVLGCGSWGTALAIHLGRCGHEVRLWGRDADLVKQLVGRRRNAVYLPGVELPQSRASHRRAGECRGWRSLRRRGGAVARRSAGAPAGGAIPPAGRDGRRRGEGHRGWNAPQDVRGDRPGGRRRAGRDGAVGPELRGGGCAGRAHRGGGGRPAPRGGYGRPAGLPVGPLPAVRER